MVKDMAFVAYSVRDVPKAIAFYRDVMGLKPGASFGEHWAEFDVGSTTFGIGNGEPLGIAPVRDPPGEIGPYLIAATSASVTGPPLLPQAERTNVTTAAMSPAES